MVRFPVLVDHRPDGVGRAAGRNSQPQSESLPGPGIYQDRPAGLASGELTGMPVTRICCQGCHGSGRPHRAATVLSVTRSSTAGSD